jgi:hypothetical protein
VNNTDLEINQTSNIEAKNDNDAVNEINKILFKSKKIRKLINRIEKAKNNNLLL